jgi:hypothetical protein
VSKSGLAEYTVANIEQRTQYPNLLVDCNDSYPIEDEQFSEIVWKYQVLAMPTGEVTNGP